MSLLDLALALFAAPVLVPAVYLLVLTLLSRRQRPPAPGVARLRFDIVVPAHDEEAGIGETLRSLLAIDYPRELFRVLVVADNCSDQTAARAREAGASVLERDDLVRRGKGYALELAFAHCLAGSTDALVVIDADTVVAPNLLHAFAARLQAGAQAVQADYAVRNPDASWRTRLMTIAFATFHELRSLARERLSVSCGLRGNGMCFTRGVLAEVPHQAFSLVEDVEYGVRLGEAGHRVHFAGEAHVYGEMVAGEKASRSQRRRWEGGRYKLARQHGPRLIGGALTRRDPVLADLAMDLLVPPLSLLALWVALGLAASCVLAWRQGVAGAALIVWSACVLCLAAYVLRGWQLSRTGLRGLADLCCAPAFVAWKLALALLQPFRKSDEWVRTGREDKTGG
jgi:GT2 family glycosyltransferase